MTTAEQRFPAAEQDFEGAIAIYQRNGLPWDEAEALHSWGRSQLSAGRVTAALAKLDGALDIYRSRGAGEAWTRRVLANRQRAEGKAAAERARRRPSTPTALRSNYCASLRPARAIGRSPTSS